MSLVAFLKKAARGAGLGLPLGLLPAIVLASASANANGYQDLYFAFVVEKGAVSTVSEQEHKAKAPLTFSEGQTFSSDELMTVLASSSSETLNQPLYKNAEVVGVLEFGKDVQPARIALGTCKNLDFLNADYADYGTSIECDGYPMSIQPNENGVAILKGDEIAAQLKLAKGYYRLNGTPFLVN